MDNEEIVNEDFEVQLKSLKEIYEQSTLKEKHKLNEYIKYILQAHGSKNTEEIERDLK
ncbi:hypothetical protein [Pontibacterium sp.]|uniref:hypothetical protein n=1 Tax=Pontibacterium sp. TaxID=2036026 RepID=UPI00356B5AC3